MEYTHLGRTGLSVSRLCLGTMNFGRDHRGGSHAIMDTAHDNGINFFDTANVYGGDRRARGATEEIVGDWFAQGGERREKTVLATKLYGDMGDWPNEGKLSALNIRRALDASLKRLQTDYIDLYQFHHVDRATPWDEIWQAIEVAVAQGKILYAGSSNFAGWHIAQAQAAAARRNFIGLVSEQSIYNLLDPRRRARGAAGRAALRPRRHPVVAAAGRPARRRAAQGARRQAPARGPRGRDPAGASRRRSSSTRTSPPSSATSPATSRWPGCCTSRRSPRPIIGPRTQEQLDGAACARSTSRSTTRPSPGSTRSSPATRPRPRTTPGDPGRHSFAPWR